MKHTNLETSLCLSEINLQAEEILIYFYMLLALIFQYLDPIMNMNLDPTIIFYTG